MYMVLFGCTSNLIERIANNELNATIASKPQHKDTPQVLMLGDSNGRRMEPTLSSDPRITLTFHQSATLAKTLSDLKSGNTPDKWNQAQVVIIQLGTNDLQNGANTRQTHSMTSDLANFIINKGKKVVICEIPPFRDNANLDMETTIHNRLICNLPTTTPNISLISYRETTNDYPDSDTFSDHIHLRHEGLAAKYIMETIIKHLTTMDMTTIPQNETPEQQQQLTRQSETKDYQPRPQRPFSRSFAVPKEKAGLIIGVKQSGIQKLKETHNVMISYISVRNSDPVFKVTGNKNNVLQTEEEINRLIDRKDTLPPPPTTRGHYTSTSTNALPNTCNCDICKPPNTQCHHPPRHHNIPAQANECNCDTWETPNPTVPQPHHSVTMA
jgi:hypothetical protein